MPMDKPDLRSRVSGQNILMNITFIGLMVSSTCIDLTGLNQTRIRERRKEQSK